MPPRSDHSTTLLHESTGNNDFDECKGIIFDIDGTLCDSWKLGFDATQEVLVNNGIDEIDMPTYHEGTRYSTPQRLARHAGLLPGDVDFETVGNELGREFDDLYVARVNTETAGFYMGIHDILRNTPSHVALGVLTNACFGYAHAVLHANNVRDRFGSIRGADNVPNPKPSGDGLIVCCSDLALDAKDCVYIGDSPSDAAAARAAGMRAIGVSWGSHSLDSLRQAPFECICSNVQELQLLLPQTVAITTTKA